MTGQYEKININDINPVTYNPRKISNKEYNKLSNSINEYGVINPIIINLKNNHIIGGNQRYDVLYDEYLHDGSYEELNLIRIGDIGWAFPSTDLNIKDLSQEKAMNLALNKINGEWDIGKLETLLIDLDVEDYNIDLTGFDNLDIQEFNINLKQNITLNNPQDQLEKTLQKEEKIKEKNLKQYNNQKQETNNKPFQTSNENIIKEETENQNITIYGEETNNDKEELICPKCGHKIK